ncbi:MAG: type IV secretory system conjugative DNA transfer family protein [Cyanobacteria bacterium J06635_15]
MLLLQTQPISEQPVNQPGGNYTTDYQPFTFSPAMILLGVAFVGFFAAVAIAQSMSGGTGKKNIIGAARWAMPKDKNMARRTGLNQIKNQKHDEVTLWINAPNKIDGEKINGDARTIYLPDMARGTAVIGGSGSGKSFSVIRPTLRAAIAQGLPSILLDTDYPGLTKTIAPLAESVGYDVHIFAPGYPESRVCNVLDFVKDCRDGTGASQIAKTLNKNFAMGNSKNEDLFFKVSGELATEAALLLAKALKHKDILTAFTILKDEDMIDRVRGVGQIDPWLELAFGQLMSTAKSEKTVDSIRGTAALLFGQLMRPDILPALIGETTMPLEVTGKNLLIFGVKQDIRLVVSPLIASIIHAIVTSNVKPGRQEPLFLSLDEMPSMYFPEISEWLAEKRKYGLCTLLGYQSLGQLKKTYGPELADVIYTNTATKFFFNPQSIESAKIFSETLGENDIVYKTKSRTYGKSRTLNEHRTKKRLFSPEEFMSLDAGSCVLISPGYGTRNQRFVPVKLDPIKITKKELDIESASKGLWNEFLTRAIRKGVSDKRIATDEIDRRSEDFKSRLPIVDTKAGQLDNLLSEL